MRRVGGRSSSTGGRAPGRLVEAPVPSLEEGARRAVPIAVAGRIAEEGALGAGDEERARHFDVARGQVLDLQLGHLELREAVGRHRLPVRRSPPSDAHVLPCVDPRIEADRLPQPAGQQVSLGERIGDRAVGEEREADRDLLQKVQRGIDVGVVRLERELGHRPRRLEPEEELRIEPSRERAPEERLGIETRLLLAQDPHLEHRPALLGRDRVDAPSHRSIEVGLLRARRERDAEADHRAAVALRVDERADGRHGVPRGERREVEARLDPETGTLGPTEADHVPSTQPSWIRRQSLGTTRNAHAPGAR